VSLVKFPLIICVRVLSRFQFIVAFFLGT